MDFWCHASALFALSWARRATPTSSSAHARGGLRQQLCARPRAHSGFTEHTESETPWRAASALASALSLGCCSYTACSSRLDESRCHSLPTLIHPPPRPRAHPHRIFLRPRPHPRPHPTLVAHSLTFTSTPALAPGTLTLTSLHCARRCRLLGASVGAISSLCDAAVSDAHRARLLCARRGYLVGRSRSAALRQRAYSGRPPGRRSPPALAPAGPG